MSKKNICQRLPDWLFLNDLATSGLVRCGGTTPAPGGQLIQQKQDIDSNLPASSIFVETMLYSFCWFQGRALI